MYWWELIFICICIRIISFSELHLLENIISIVPWVLMLGPVVILVIVLLVFFNWCFFQINKYGCSYKIDILLFAFVVIDIFFVFAVLRLYFWNKSKWTSSSSSGSITSEFNYVLAFSRIKICWVKFGLLFFIFFLITIIFIFFLILVLIFFLIIIIVLVLLIDIKELLELLHELW